MVHFGAPIALWRAELSSWASWVRFFWVRSVDWMSGQDWECGGVLRTSGKVLFRDVVPKLLICGALWCIKSHFEGLS